MICIHLIDGSEILVDVEFQTFGDVVLDAEKNNTEWLEVTAVDEVYGERNVAINRRYILKVTSFK